MFVARIALLALAVTSAGAFVSIGNAFDRALIGRASTAGSPVLELTRPTPEVTHAAHAGVVSVIDAVADLAAKLPNQAWESRLAHGFSPNAHWRDLPLVGIDIEGRWFKKRGEAYPSQIGVVRVEDGALAGERMFRVTPRNGKINYMAEQRRLIDPRRAAVWLEDPDSTSLAASPRFEDIAEEFQSWTEGALPVVYGGKWDKIGLAQEWAATSLGKPPNILRDHVMWIDVHELTWALSRSSVGNTLSDAHLRLLGRPLEGAHTSTTDARGTLEVLFALGEVDGAPQKYGELVRYLVAIEQNIPELAKLARQRLKAAN